MQLDKSRVEKEFTIGCQAQLESGGNCPAGVISHGIFPWRIFGEEVECPEGSGKYTWEMSGELSGKRPNWEISPDRHA